VVCLPLKGSLTIVVVLTPKNIEPNSGGVTFAGGDKYASDKIAIFLLINGYVSETMKTCT